MQKLSVDCLIVGNGPAPEKGNEVAIDYCGTLVSHEEWSQTDVSEWVKAQQGMEEYAQVLAGAAIDGKKLLGENSTDSTTQNSEPNMLYPKL